MINKLKQDIEDDYIFLDSLLSQEITYKPNTILAIYNKYPDDIKEMFIKYLSKHIEYNTLKILKLKLEKSEQGEPLSDEDLIKCI
jgi:hypothetical protein